MKRELNFEIKNSTDLNAMLMGLIMDVRRGEVENDKAKTISLIADKINKNNVNELEYKKLSKKEMDIDFFEKIQN